MKIIAKELGVDKKVKSISNKGKNVIHENVNELVDMFNRQ